MQGRQGVEQRDRFHLVERKEKDRVRPYHPSYKDFNAAAPEARRVIRGHIVHAKTEHCFNYSRAAWQLPVSYYKLKGISVNGDQKTLGHPNGRPACIGDGKNARRWQGGDANNFQDIVCPNDQCEFASNPDGTKPPCGPAMQFIFMLVGANDTKLNPMLARFDSHGWNTTANFVGFFDEIKAAAENLGLTDWSLFSYPFTLVLGEETQPSKQRRYQVVTITPNVEPVVFFKQQRGDIRALASGVPEVITVEEEIAEMPSVLELPTIAIPATPTIEPKSNNPDKDKLTEWRDLARANKKEPEFIKAVAAAVPNKKKDQWTADDFKAALEAVLKIRKELEK